MNKAELLKTIRNSLFNNQGTDVQSALSAAHSVIDTITDPASRIGALTAMHVVLNTVANAIEALPDPLPAPAEEIKIETVQLSVDRATLDDIIDARINSWYENDFDMDHEVSRVIDDYDFSDTVRDIVRNNISFSIDVD
jgi:hypothetical protein